MSELDAMSDPLVWPVYGWEQGRKKPLMLSALTALNTHHAQECPAYRDILQKVWFGGPITDLESLPFLPVRLFKHAHLQSVPDTEVIKTMTSSGTSGQRVSQIFLDKKTSAFQVKVLSRIMAEFIGPHRLPMLVIDCRATVADRLKFSARTAGILGFSMFGRDVVFALDDDMSLSEARVRQFLDKYPDQPVLIFGFTFMVWLHFLRQLESHGSTWALEQGILIHGGGGSSCNPKPSIQKNSRTGSRR